MTTKAAATDERVDQSRRQQGRQRGESKRGFGRGTRRRSREFMTSFQADPDVAEMLRLAIDGTGRSMTDLVNAALRRQLPEVVEDFYRRQASLAETLRKIRKSYEEGGEGVIGK